MTETAMSKGEKLIWELFEMVRELLPINAANTERLTKWAQEFRGMHDPAAAPAAEDTTEPSDHPAGMRAKRK